MAYADLTPSEQFVFEWQYRMAGSFATTLAETFCRADIYNFASLRRAFPDAGNGMYNYLHTPGWWEACERKGMNHMENFEPREPHTEAPRTQFARICIMQALKFIEEENAALKVPPVLVHKALENALEGKHMKMADVGADDTGADAEDAFRERQAEKAESDELSRIAEGR